jgi:putative transposase
VKLHAWEITVHYIAHHVEDKLLDEIRKNVNRGMVLGRDRFKEEIEQLTGRRMKPNKAGRPVGWRKKTT